MYITTLTPTRNMLSLTIKQQRHIGAVVTYMKRLGIQNIGRFVSRLPPVLGYDVNTNLAPKMGMFFLFIHLLYDIYSLYVCSIAIHWLLLIAIVMYVDAGSVGACR
jgi:hypothetical protein